MKIQPHDDLTRNQQVFCEELKNIIEENFDLEDALSVADLFECLITALMVCCDKLNLDQQKFLIKVSIDGLKEHLKR